MSIRKDFISYTSGLAPILPLDVLAKITGQNFILPFYHVVSDEDCPHIKHLYHYKGVKEFERDIDYLAMHYQAIGADDLADVIGGKYKGKKIMLLSFDDGLRQIYEVVAPMLLRKGIPAIFFLNTDFIDNKKMMFRYKASLAVEIDAKRFRGLLKCADEKELNEAYDGELNESFQRFLKDYKPYMSSEQIKQLMGQGFAVGSHSAGHSYYSKLSVADQLTQTFSSIDILKRDYGVSQKLFAFPFTDDGVSREFFNAIFKEDKVDFSFGGAGIKTDIYPRQMQRIPMEEGHASAEQILKSEYLYCMLRMPIFMNKIKRS